MRKNISLQEKSEKLHFDKFADVYDANYGYKDLFTKYKIQKKSKLFLNYINKLPNEKRTRILEVGCGTGEYTNIIAKNLKKSKIIALDISSKIISIAKKKTNKQKNIVYTVASIYDSKIKDSSIDVVCGFYVLHHFDLETTFKELYRILKPGGIIFFYEPNILNPVVFIIKSIPWIKKRVGDSPDEWALNPLFIKYKSGGFKILKIGITEFIIPVKFLGLKSLKAFDKLFQLFSFIPFLRYFGGSVYFIAQKEK